MIGVVVVVWRTLEAVKVFEFPQIVGCICVVITLSAKTPLLLQLVQTVFEHASASEMPPNTH